MQIYELTQSTLTEAGLLSRAYDATKQVAQKYIPPGRAVGMDLVNRLSRKMGGTSMYSQGDIARTFAGATPEPAADTTTTTAADSASTNEPATTTPKLSTTQINQAIAGIRTRDLQSIKKNIDTVLTNRQKAPAATSTPASNAMASMAGQLTAKPTTSSTGGTVTPTSTGVIHTAKPAASAATAAPAATAPLAKKAKTAVKTKPVAKTKPTKISAPPQPGAPTSAEYANLEKRLQQAMAAQGKVK